MRYILKINRDYNDTSIAKFDNSIVEVLKYHDGIFRFAKAKKTEAEKESNKAEIIKEEYVDIKVNSGEVFCSVPYKWLTELSTGHKN